MTKRLIRLLTPREHQVLTLVSDGLTSTEIAFSLNLSLKTIDNHRTNLYRKIGATNSVQAARVYWGIRKRRASRQIDIISPSMPSKVQRITESCQPVLDQPIDAARSSQQFGRATEGKG